MIVLNDPYDHDHEEQDFEQLGGGKCPWSMLHLLLFSVLRYTYLHAMLKHDSNLCCIASVSTLLTLVDDLVMSKCA
jgi:hypothetical protein